MRGRRPPECLYGSLKMWDYLRRQGIRVARCTVERLKAAEAADRLSDAKRGVRGQIDRITLALAASCDTVPASVSPAARAVAAVSGPRPSEAHSTS